MNNIYSQEKFKKFKNRYIHYNHTQELQDYNEENFKYYPQEFRYFMKHNKHYDTLAYCNSIYFDYLSQVDKPKLSGLISDTIGNLNAEKIEEIKNVILDNDIMTPLLKRSRATYQIDFDRSVENRVTQSLLHIYSSAYENKEALFILKWIIEGMQNKPLTTNFDYYRDKYGNISKGRLLNSIIKDSKKYTDFSTLLNNAYNKKIRHLCFHNAAELNDEKKIIKGIDNPKLQVGYREAFESFYTLQQLQNYIRLFATILLIEEENIINEGVFNAATLYFEGDKSQLFLFQLFPFYEYDSNNDKQMKEIWIEKDNNFFKFYSNKEIIRIEKDSILSKWYEEKLDKTIRIVPAYPDIYEEGVQTVIVRTKDYGSFAIGTGYEVKLNLK